MIEPELSELYTQTVKLYEYVGVNEYAQDSYADTPTIAACHIDGRSGASTQSGGMGLFRNGQQVRVDGTVHLTTVYPWLTERARMYVPHLSDPSGFREVDILSVDTLYDETGPYAQTVYYSE